MELQLSDKDFRDLLFPIMEKGKGAILDRIPELKNAFHFKKYTLSLEKDAIIRYIFLVYDKRSPLQKSSDPLKRKTMAAAYAGWEANDDGLFSDEVDKVMKCQNSAVNAMIVAFVRMFNDPRWTTLVAGNEALYQKMEAMISLGRGENEKETAAIEKTKGDLFNQIENMSIKLTDTVNSILNDENPLLRRDLFCTIDEEIKNRLNITPERMAGIE